MKRRHKINLQNAVIGAILSASVYFSGLFLFWQFYPYQTAEVNQPIEVQNQDDYLSPGEEIELLIVINKASSLDSEVQRIVQCNNGELYGVTSRDNSSRVPEGEFIRRRFFTLSEDVEPGTICIFKFIIDYHPNPIRIITREWVSEPFEIVAGVE